MFDQTVWELNSGRMWGWGPDGPLGSSRETSFNLQLANRHQIQAQVTPINFVFFSFQRVRYGGTTVFVPTHLQVDMIYIPTGVFS